MAGIKTNGQLKCDWAKEFLMFNLSADETEILCSQCFTKFHSYRKANLSRHVEKFHPDLVSLEDLPRRQILDTYLQKCNRHMAQNFEKDNPDIMRKTLLKVGPMAAALTEP